MGIVIAGDVRNDATIPADVISRGPQVFGDCHLQTAARIIYREIELHNALAKCLLTHHCCPADQGSIGQNCSRHLSIDDRKWGHCVAVRHTTACALGISIIIPQRHRDCALPMPSKAPVTDVEGASRAEQSRQMKVVMQHLWLSCRAPVRTSAALAVPLFTKITTGFVVRREGCLGNTCKDRSPATHTLSITSWLRTVCAIGCPGSRKYAASATASSNTPPKQKL